MWFRQWLQSSQRAQLRLHVASISQVSASPGSPGALTALVECHSSGESPCFSSLVTPPSSWPVTLQVSVCEGALDGGVT